MKKIIAEALMLSVAVIILGVSVFLVLMIPEPIKTPYEIRMLECRKTHSYITCEAIEVCGGIENVKKVTSGGFFGVGKGFECQPTTQQSLDGGRK